MVSEVVATEPAPTANPDPTATTPPLEVTPIAFGSFEMGEMRAETDSEAMVVPFNLTGQAQPGSTIEFGYDDELVGETTVDDDGEWAFQEDISLPPGEYDFYARMVDEDGTELDISDTFPVEIPEPIAIEPPTMNLMGGETTVGGVLLAGTAAPDSEVQIVVNGEISDTVSVDEEGKWVYEAKMPAGEYEISVRIETPDGETLDSPIETITIAEPDVFAVAEADGNFTGFLVSVEATNLVDAVADLEEITIFAPTDTAFSKLPDEILVGLFSNPDFTRSLLLRHVVSGNFQSDGLEAGQVLETSAGTSLTITNTESATSLAVNDIPISIVDIAGNNGVVHGIDTIIMPEFDAPAPVINADGETVEFEGSFLTVVGTGGN